MEGSKLFTTSESGVYKCAACTNLSVHVKGHPKSSCSDCGSNSNWIIKRQTTGKSFYHNQKSALC